MRAATAKHLSRLHAMLYRATSGVVGRRLVDNDMLLLTTTGRRSERSHTVPLLYLGNGRGFVVFASWGGREDHPEWYLNLLACPDAMVQVGSERLRVVARTASGEERQRWWERALAAYDGYRVYQSRTDRLIPVVVLETV